MAHYGDFQFEIYLQTSGRALPRLPVSAADLERAAHAVMTPEARAYVAGGAGSESTVRANAGAFERWRIVPRMLRGTAERDWSSSVLGTSLPAPVLLAPVGVLGVVHPDGELAAARAAGALGVPMVLSTLGSVTLEEVAAELGGNPAWFQLYWPTDREVTASLVGRAERAGYRAIVVTVDTLILAWRPRDLAQGYLPFLAGEGLANYFADPAFLAGLDRSPEQDLQAAVLRWAGMFANPALTWDDLRWLRSITDLPILVKGISHADDARRAIDAGVNGVVVSNHGGRQVDGAVAALDCLPDVVAAAGDVPVLFDSGVRTGADVLKAMALGARAVLVGRPYVYGLALSGEDGVRHALRCLLADFDLTGTLAGVRTLADLTPDVLRPTP
ncbi:MAG: alpha-hydroxy-acid oxidizing protein [Actinobacteria bacterium]|nr:alpha-hydroxy-acid oxidizing protein [Actinomycetota bacterium]MBI3688798.1 alpha-hydroxy-acid oxidizing protein [Actinomycetota bacterium]